MKYKHRRRFHQILRRKQITFNHVKKILTIAAACIALWIMFFQGTPWPARDTASNVVLEESKKISESTSSSLPMLYIVISMAILFGTHRILVWWFYDRGEYVSNVRMLTDKERKMIQEQERMMKN